MIIVQLVYSIGSYDNSTAISYSTISIDSTISYANSTARL